MTVLDALTERQIVGVTIYGEARREPLVGRVAIGCVIRNRLARPKRFGATWREVCLRRWQFSCWIVEGGAKNHEIVMTAAAQLASGAAPRPGSALASALWIADGVMTHAVEDVTQGADHYYAPLGMQDQKPPSWSAPPATLTTVIAAHRFYRVA